MTTRAKTMVQIAILPIALLALAACDLRVEGEQGNLFFEYDQPSVLSFSNDVAVGARADVAVSTDEDGTVPAPIDEVAFDPAGVLSLVELGDRGFTVAADAAGATRVEVTSGEVYDAVEMEASEVTDVAIRFPNPFELSDEQGVFVQGGTSLVPYDLEHDDVQVVGYGFPGFTADPASAATIADGTATRDWHFLHVTFAETGTVTLDHDLAESGLEREVVPQSAITGLAWDSFAGSESLPLDAEGVLFLEATLADDTLAFGLRDVATVESADSGICEVEPSDLWGDNTYEIHPVEQGTCTVQATLDTLSADFTIEIGPPEGDE